MGKAERSIHLIMKHLIDEAYEVRRMGYIELEKLMNDDNLEIEIQTRKDEKVVEIHEINKITIEKEFVKRVVIHKKDGELLTFPLRNINYHQFSNYMRDMTSHLVYQPFVE